MQFSAFFCITLNFYFHMIILRLALILCFFLIMNLQAQFFPFANSDSLKQYIAVLGHDTLQGRATGTSGSKKAAGFISKKLQRWNIKTAGENNTYFQKIPLHGTTPLEQSELQIVSENKRIYLKLGSEYLLIKTGAQTFIPNPVGLVFCGYGIIAPEYDHNDYQSIDVKGKIAVMFDGEPLSENDSDFFDGERRTLYAYPEAKIRTAISQGALGTIIIQSSTEDDWNLKQREYSFEEVSLPARVTGHLGVFIKEEVAPLLFENAGYSFDDVKRKHASHELEAFSLNSRMSFNGRFIQRDFKSENILAKLEGSDPELKKTYLIIGAHYDHLGIGTAVNGDSIYNGVLDNAAGVAVVLEMARLFSQLEKPPARSIIFAFFTGEEKGVLGSRYYTSNPAVPLSKTIAMINVDGLSAIGKFLSVIPVGGKYSELGEIFTELALELGLKSNKENGQLVYDDSFARSDQITFAQAGVPSVLILEGFDYDNISNDQAIQLTENWFKNRYHTPFDDLNQPIDYQAIKRYSDLIFAFSNRLLNSSAKPEWYEDAPFRPIRLRLLNQE